MPPPSAAVALRLALYPSVFLLSWVVPCADYLHRIFRGGPVQDFTFQVFVALAYGEGVYTMLVFAVMERWPCRLRDRCGARAAYEALPSADAQDTDSAPSR